MFNASFYNLTHKKQKPDVVIVTPLLPDHKVSKDTKFTLKRNNTPFAWVKSIGNNNIPMNVWNGIQWYEKHYNYEPKYLLPIDRDIIAGRNMVDRMVRALEISGPDVAYTYASFEFKGAVNRKFPAVQFNIQKLCEDNYISSNSMIKLDKLKEIGGPVVSDKYKRLLDWCLWLKFFDYGYVGNPCVLRDIKGHLVRQASFIAISTKDDISAQSDEDYREKKVKVFEDFIKPIADKHSIKMEELRKKEEDMVSGDDDVLELDI